LACYKMNYSLTDRALQQLWRNFTSVPMLLDGSTIIFYSHKPFDVARSIGHNLILWIFYSINYWSLGSNILSRNDL